MRLTARLFLFLLPFAVFPGLPIAVAFVAGELTPLSAVVDRQMREPVLYGRAYRDDYFAFKLVSAERRQPEVLVLGSSRVMQFRAATIGADPGRFYNAGGAASTAADALEFYRRLRATSKPRVLILGLDQVWLTRASAFDREKMAVADADAAADLQRTIRVSHRVIEDLYAGRVSLGRVLRRIDPNSGGPALGITAIMQAGGFRADGSYQYAAGRGVDRPLDDRMREGYERLDQGVVPMVPAARIDPAALAQVRELLAMAKEDGVAVTGFMTPYAPSTVAAMKRHGGLGYLAELPAALGALFGEFGYGFMDWSDPSPLGVTDEDMIDYFHPSEDVVRRIYGALHAR